MGILFRKAPKPRRFNHVPIYWDPAKEKLKEMEEKAMEEKKAEETGEYKISIQRGSFRKYSERLEVDKRAREQKKIMYKLIFVLLVLAALALFLIFNSGAIYSLYFDNGI